MRTYSPIKTDLVIGMTLAELFLLILFVVWYRYGPGSGPDWKQRAEERQLQIDKLNAQVASDNARIARLQEIEEFWKRNFGIGPPTTVEELTDALKSKQGEAIRTQMLRGFPKCDQSDNTLVEAVLKSGQVELRIRQPIGDAALKQWAKVAGVRLPSAGAVLSGDLAANGFLSTLEQFYSRAKATSKPCRFDYRLRWTTDTDYRIGRERLERYLYPAGITAAGLGK